MRILLLGKNGQLGSQLYNQLRKEGKTVLGLSRQDLDFSHFQILNERISNFLPTLVINTAAYTDVDGAECARDTAYLINGMLPVMIAERCEKIGARMLHFSTDYVFDGEKQDAYLETDTVNPINYYGYSKSIGESVVNFQNVYLVRTGWLYSQVGKNFFLAIRNKLATKQPISVVDDQIGVPCSIKFLVTKLVSMIELIEKQMINPGIYHLVPSGFTSWYGFSKAIIESFQQQLSIPIKPISSNELGRVAKRPHYSVLNTTKIEVCLGESMPTWIDVYHDFFKEFYNES